MSDRRVLYSTAFLRALATGLVAVLIGIHLAKLGLDPGAIGLVLGAGLAGAAAATLLATLAGDRIGRRRFLLAIALLGAVGTAVVAAVSTVPQLVVAAFFGMLNAMGHDRGAALVVEQAILPATVSDRERTRAFAWYNVLQDVGHALGGLLAAAPVLIRSHAAIAEIASMRILLATGAVLILLTATLYLRLSPAVESDERSRSRRLSPQSRRVLWRISALFGLDGFGGGFLATALLSYFFYSRFGVDEAVIGPLFFAARIANALSHLGAAWLARRIGLVNTMVFTHIPGSLLLVTVAFAPSFPVAAALFLVRESLVQMDVPTRQSYVMAMVRPEERTIASGVTHLVRLGTWAAAPPVAGFFMQGLSLTTPLVVGAVLKIIYDLLLYSAFRREKPPEELMPLRNQPG